MAAGKAGTLVSGAGDDTGTLGPVAMAEWKLSRKDGGSEAAVAAAGAGLTDAGEEAVFAAGGATGCMD